MKFFQHVSELVVDFLFRECADAADHALYTLVAGRLKRSQDDALFVG